MNKHANLASLLLDLQKQLIQSNLHQDSIDPSLLESAQPFHHDKLQAQQWLQFIFIARLEQMVQLNMALPTSCDITPYIAEALKEHSDITKITAITQQIDTLLSN